MRQRRILQKDAFRCSTTASAAPKLLSVLLGRFSSLVVGHQHVFERRAGIFLPPRNERVRRSQTARPRLPTGPGGRVLNDPPSGPMDNLLQGRCGIEQKSGGKGGEGSTATVIGKAAFAAFPRIAAKGVGGLTGVTPPSTLISQLGVGQF